LEQSCPLVSKAMEVPAARTKKGNRKGMNNLLIMIPFNISVVGPQ
jgi:hypothetical protein